MAKKKRRDLRVRLSDAQRTRFGQDIEALGLTPDTHNVEIRFDVSDPEIKQKADALAQHGLVRVRQTGKGEQVWRVALTRDGEEVAREHFVRAQRTRRAPTESGRSLTDAELAKRKSQRDDEFAASGQFLKPSKGGLRDINWPQTQDVFISTETLRAFQVRAAKKGMSRILTQEVLDRLNLNWRHRIRDAKHHTTDDGKYTNIRMIVDIGLNPERSVLETHEIVAQEEVQTEQAVVDISHKDWDMLMVPYQAQLHEALRHMGGSRPGTNALYMAAPKWTATHSYDVVHNLHSYYQGNVAAFDRAGWHGPVHIPNRFGHFVGSNRDANEAVLTGDDAINFITHPRSLMNAEALDYLHKAHPIVIDPEWVELQEEWTSNEAWAYAQRVVLPFDPLYLDFTGPGGRAAMIDVLGYKAMLTGCLIYTDQKTGRLTVQPIGGRDMLDISQQTGYLAAAFPYEQVGRIVFGGRCEYGAPFGVAFEERQLADVTGLYVVPQTYADITSQGVACDLPDYQDQRNMDAQDGRETPIPFGVEAQAVPGYFELPIKPEEALLAAHTREDEVPVPRLMVWNATVATLTTKALSMLSLIDNEHVELREAGMGRTDRRRVERDRRKGRAHGVASEIVVVRRERYVGGQKVEDEGAIEYTHQWRVRRHEQHHGPHTRTYQAKPWLAKPCGRCGSCRRFIIDSYIKGPEGTPLKEKKTYVFRQKEEDC